MDRLMKDSGVEWIGKIPEKWEMRKLKHILRERNEKNDPIITRDILSLTAAQGVIPYSEKEGGGNKPKDDFSAYKIARPNDVVMNSMNILSGSVGLSKYFGCVSPVYYMLYSDSEDVNIEFYNYIFQTSIFQKSLRGLGNGIMMKETEDGKLNTIRMRIPMEKLGGLLLPLPDGETQNRIVNYLNAIVPEIDNVIETTKATIEDYKKYKQSLITEAVTKGLNPDVEMKDSGITHIGRIPENWDITKLKYLFESGDGCLKIGPFGSAIKGKTLDNGPYKIYNQAHLIQNDFSLSRHFVSEETYKELFSYRVLPDDILFSMMGTIGKCRIVPQGLQEGIMDSHLLKARLNTKINVDYFQYVYDKDNSLVVISQLLEMSNGSIMNGLNSTIVKNIVIPLPPIKEQIKIVDYLHEKCTEIDNIISAKEKLVEDMENYKKSLIYEYVTGKKEVSDNE